MRMATTMTMKAFLEAIVSFEGMTPELVEKAELELGKLASKSEKRKTSKAALAKASADEALRETMLSLMGAEPVLSGEMAVLVSEATGTAVSTSKVAAMFKALVAEGKVIEGEGKSKGRKVKAFTKVGAEPEVEDEAVEGEVEG